jgi:hypothetical protein
VVYAYHFLRLANLSVVELKNLNLQNTKHIACYKKIVHPGTALKLPAFLRIGLRRGVLSQFLIKPTSIPLSFVTLHSDLCHRPFAKKFCPLGKYVELPPGPKIIWHG